MGNTPRFCQHVVGKDARQLMLSDHHLDIDAEVVGEPSTSITRPPGRSEWANW